MAKKRSKRKNLPASLADAKSVFDCLQFEVDPLIFPTPDIIVAELRYSFDGTVWLAAVTKEAVDSGVPVYRLWYQRGGCFQRSGVYSNGSALVIYLRAQAAEMFKGFQPQVDTLANITGRSPVSLVPVCYGTYSGNSKCRTCPYSGVCRVCDQKSKPLAGIEESESVFLLRLRGKVRSGDWLD